MEMDRVQLGELDLIRHNQNETNRRSRTVVAGPCARGPNEALLHLLDLKQDTTFCVGTKLRILF